MDFFDRLYLKVHFFLNYFLDTLSDCSFEDVFCKEKVFICVCLIIYYIIIRCKRFLWIFAPSDSLPAHAIRIDISRESNRK